jgi:tripartite-type tricarboxylate transporter receptor subunit TctC
MNNRRKWLAVVWTALPMTIAVAADYPAKPVHIISPYTPGGGNDVICRAVAVRLGPIMGQPAVVENKPGANTIIGTDYVAKSPPDGYTMILVPSAHTVNPHLYEKLPYDSVRDFTPITQVGSAPLLLVVNASLPIKSIRDLIQAAKGKPNEITYGTSGSGSAGHLAGALLGALVVYNCSTSHTKVLRRLRPRCCRTKSCSASRLPRLSCRTSAAAGCVPWA